jgi:CheY-like chemotaxis protein
VVFTSNASWTLAIIMTAPEQPRAGKIMPTEKIILIVEDDEQVRAVIAEMLLSEGFKVMAAANASDALDILRDTAQPIHLLLTDIAMPERLNGFGLAQRAKQLRPDLPVVYASAYFSDAPWQELGLGYGPMLVKPFKSQELIGTIRDTLQGKS